MTERIVIRQDTYVLRRPVFELELVDTTDGTIAPFDMSGCTIRATFKPTPTDPNTDPTDDAATAPLKCDIVFAANGSVSSASGFRLPDGATAADGLLWLVASSAATLNLPLATPLQSDVQVTDGNGEHITILSAWTLTAADGLTNRTS